ncbi:hypothetical protein BCU33_013380 [Vibrio lentus]|uniref:hypothetical protein n=1 Tax=Vibrio lentus TaxID=136468 RepID=UPI000C815878|nr:hypothetical protein [Vibrio lentus]PMI92719.1 hypothetical protein BCU33_22850 [Vibrio lentus]TKF45973.1 hypothetical protein FCV64_09410 [Vibrio lentus]
MKGLTKDFYQLFLEAKGSFVESEVIIELDGDISNYNDIYEKISLQLQEPSGIGIDSLPIRKQLVIEAKLTPELTESINQSLDSFMAIRAATRDKVTKFCNKAAWIKAIHFSFIYFSHRKVPVNFGHPDEYDFIANSLSYLKAKGFHIECIDGLIRSDDSELTRLSQAIDIRAKKLGQVGFKTLTSVLNDHFSKDQQRFFFYRKRPTLPIAQKPHPPHGYVYNLVCKYIDLPCKLNKSQQANLLNEIQDLSTHLATIIDIDKMSPWSSINTSSENILEKLQEWVLYPEVFYIPQISPIHGKVIFPRLFELIDNNTSDTLSEIDKASKVMNRIEDAILKDAYIYGYFSEKGICQLCADIDSPANIKKIVESLSKPSYEINKRYITPFHAVKSNLREFPLIKTKTGYVVANIATYNVAKYWALLRLSEKYNSKAEQRLGYALEDFVKESFDNANIMYHHSFKFLSPDYIKQIAKTNRDNGECDFIIESKDYIYLIEVKKKGITKESQAGSSLHMLFDASLSFFKSINQLTVAELILLNDGEICNSENGEKIELKDRTIYKLVISLEDMASLQCDNIKNSLLQSLYGAQINVLDSSYSSITNKINKTLEEFTFLHQELITKGERYQHVPFHCVSYLSTPQLLTLLEDVYSNDDFSNHINRSNTIVYSLMDWYASYKASKSNKLIKENEEVFKNKVLIN